MWPNRMPLHKWSESKGRSILYSRNINEMDIYTQQINDLYLQGYLFYGTKILIHDMPSNRRTDEYWGLYHDGSPKSVPFLLYGLDLFNFTSTFSRHSTVPLTLQPFTTLEKLINYKNMYTFGQKTSFQRKMKLAPILYIQSHCDTLTGRELYVKELGKYIAIDSYGNCLRNKTYPTGITNGSRNKTAIRDFYDFVSKYKFIIVYQDMICEDYITDKFWKSLTLGIVPIYFGATNIRVSTTLIYALNIHSMEPFFRATYQTPTQQF